MESLRERPLRLWPSHSSTEKATSLLLARTRSSDIDRTITHLTAMRKEMTRLPQLNDINELVKLCYSADSILNMTLRDQSLLDSGLIDEDGDGQTKFDILIENERGAMLFGVPLFSKNSLIAPFDPPRFQNIKGHEITDIKLFALPVSGWKWNWRNWYVLMISDVDDQGWIYSSVRFKSRHWKGIGRFGNFVRRRLWIRMREREEKDLVVCEAAIGDTLVVGDGPDTAKERIRDKLKRKLRRNNNTDDQLSSYTSEDYDEPDENINNDQPDGYAPTEPDIFEEPISEMVDADSYDPYAELYELKQKIRSCKLDRERINMLLEAMMAYDDDMLATLWSDHETAKQISTESFLESYFNEIKFTDSKRLLLTALEKRIPAEESPRTELLHKITSAYFDMIK